MVKFTFPKALKLSYNLNPVLHNRFVLYLFLIFAVVQILYFASSRDYASLMILFIVGFLASFFNKNMIVVIFLALVIANVLKYGVGSRLNEGFEGKDEETKEEEEDEKKEKKGKPESNEEATAEKVDEQYENLKQEYPKFKVVQQEILDGVKKMAPLLEKAEKFIEKFDSYKTNKPK
jgi:CBS domain containing-hemolysin-like protein